MIEDVFDDCGSDFENIEVENETHYHVLQDPLESEHSGNMYMTLSYFLETYPYSKHHVCELYGGTGNVVR